MTEEYKNELILRISRLNYTDRIYVKRTLTLCALCLFSLFLGYFMHFLPIGESEGVKRIITSHFCGFFSGLGLLDSVRAVIDFSLPDLVSVIAVALFGYTMLSGTLGKITLFFIGVKFGFCASILYESLVKSPVIEGGGSAFLLFAVCKTAILTALIFSALRSEDFSFSFGEIFLKSKHPHLSPLSREYVKTTLSTAGFTAIINTVYLVFQSLQGFTPL